MSNLQLGTLKYLINHEVTVDDIRLLNMNTFGSLVKRGWVEREGKRIMPTKPGHLAYDAYRLAGANFRQQENDPSERVRALLRMTDLSVVRKAS